jgi:c(7)-type cytochrome triheme protein
LVLLLVARIAAADPGTFDHAAHSATACVTCHAGGAAAAAKVCSGCHADPDRTAFVPANLAAPELPLAYAHAKHVARTACATCHASVAQRVPLATCETCHDGKAAFATSASCTRCHDAAPKTPWTPPKPGARFSHISHRATACASCHALAASGEPTVARHAACTGAGCHVLHPDASVAEDKAICGACHEGTEPWRHLVADRAPPDATELGASLDHGKHTAACTTCHARRTLASELRMPHGHVACSGAACHAVSGGPAPTLSTCAGCHRTGLAAERIATRLAAPWSVRAAFGHDLHDARAKLACADCHTALAGAQLLAMPTPAKATCAPCHDGKTAFKLTGTACRRCHH